MGPFKQANPGTPGSAITIICLIKPQVQCHFSALPHTKIIPFEQYYSRHFHLPPHYENNTIMRNISHRLTSQPKIQDIATFQHQLDLTPPAEIASIPEVPVMQTCALVNQISFNKDNKDPSLI